LFEIVNDHLKKAHQHVDSVIAAREKEALEKACKKASDSEVEEQESDCEDNNEEALFFHSDVEAIRCNNYGAAGSSARMSDSEIMNIKAPPVKRVPGRHRARRFMSASSRSKKRKVDMRLKEGPSSASHLMSFNTSCLLLRSCAEHLDNGGSIGDAEAFFSREDYMKARAEAVVEAKAVELETRKKKKTSKKTKDKIQKFIGGKTIQQVKYNSSDKCQFASPGVVVKEKVRRKDVKSKCKNCGLVGHKTAECYTAEVTEAWTASSI
jgi:hypothetical protein